MSSGILDVIRRQIPKQQGIEIATVISSNPLVLKLEDGIMLSVNDEDLLICSHLLPSTRYAHISNDPVTPAKVNYNGQEYEQAGDEISTQHTVISFQDYVLNPGDKVAILPLPGGQQYLVIDKVVIP